MHLCRIGDITAHISYIRHTRPDVHKVYDKKKVLQETHALLDLDSLEQDMNTALARVERDFPISTQVKYLRA